MGGDWLGKLKRGIRKPPRVIFTRIVAELRAELERFRAPLRQRLKIIVLVGELGEDSANTLWQSLAKRPYLSLVGVKNFTQYDDMFPDSRQRILGKAEEALAHCVDLLGSGIVNLGELIDWSRDFKTGFKWPKRYFRDIEYNNLEQPSDVKVAWELSRLQWLIPVGQAYLLTGKEHYADAVREILEQWIDRNPYAYSVNWACTMEVALRIITWTWFFHVFNRSQAWQDTTFQEKFLCSLYLHVEFTERHIERSDINGNHYTADAAGLVFGGLFFGKGVNAKRWQHQGWCFLEKEIQLQVYPDGVDFEASVPYHRFVMELFLLPALYRLRMNLPVDGKYRDRILKMGRYTAAYSKPDGKAPLWGDADDARALPFGSQEINDHRYLLGIAGVGFISSDLLAHFDGPRDDIFWIFGEEGCANLPKTAAPLASHSFSVGGYYVMRSSVDHVFIDCGPIGLAGRGGHGHNDCLAFEAVLDGQALISDCGAHLYTASFRERNAFRSTAYHNTPQIDGKEINRFIRPDYLWNLHYDAIPNIIQWGVEDEFVLFIGEHQGYKRLSSPVVPRRTILLDTIDHSLYINDQFIGKGMHDVHIPLHLDPSVVVTDVSSDELIVASGGNSFRVWWSAKSDYNMSIEDARVSPSYGVALATKKIVWCREAESLQSLSVYIAPEYSGRIFELKTQHWISKRDRQSI